MRMDASEQIRTLRNQSGMTRKQFAEHLGIPLRTIEDWEYGKRTPPDYIPRLIGYALKYEELIKKMEADWANRKEDA